MRESTYPVSLNEAEARSAVDVLIPHPDDVSYQMARGVVALLRSSYARQFEESPTVAGRQSSYTNPTTGAPFPAGTFEGIFNPNNQEQVRAHRDTLRRAISTGDTFALAYDQTRLVALTKIGLRDADARYKRYGITGKFMYLYDTMSKKSHRGLGAATLHAALLDRDSSEDYRVVCDGYKGSSVSRAINKLGLRRTSWHYRPEESMQVNGTPLPLVHFISPPQLTQNTLITLLEKSCPWLRGAQSTPSNE